MTIRPRYAKAFRPSRFGDPEERSPQEIAARMENLRRYAWRASLGLPIFEEPASPDERLSARLAPR